MSCQGYLDVLLKVLYFYILNSLQDKKIKMLFFKKCIYPNIIIANYNL